MSYSIQFIKVKILHVQRRNIHINAAMPITTPECNGNKLIGFAAMALASRHVTKCEDISMW